MRGAEVLVEAVLQGELLLAVAACWSEGGWGGGGCWGGRGGGDVEGSSGGGEGDCVAGFLSGEFEHQQLN